MTSDWHSCAALVERGDPARFRAVMAAPRETRAVLFPIYAMALEVARAPWVTSEPMLAEMRLQWWRDVLKEIADGTEVRPHEVSTPLAKVLTKPGAKALDQMVQGRRWDIYQDPHESEAELFTYLAQTAGNLLFAACDALGRSNAQLCKEAGVAAGLEKYLQAIPELEARGKRPLPDGRSCAVQALADRGLRHLQRARALKARAHPAPFLSLWETDAILKQVRHSPRRVVAGQLGLSPLRSAVRLNWVAATGRW